jgi:hypothetical protein
MGFFRGMDSKRKGRVLEFTGNEKSEKAVTKILGTAKDGVYFMVDKVVVDTTSTMPNTVEKDDGYQNNTYLVSGKVWYKPYDVVLDKILPSKISDFKIEYTDSRDEIGLPDIKVNTIEIK